MQTVPAVLGGRIDAVEPLVHNAGNAATGGIWRVTGPGGTAVLKLARPPAARPVGSPSWQTSSEPSHWNYWRREALAYTCGVVNAYADAGIVAPDLLASAERPDGSVEVWLSDMRGSPGTSWSPEQLGAFAHRLGVAQAGWIARVPDLPWLSRDWLSQYMANATANFARIDDWDHPAGAIWPESLRRDLRRLWDRRAAVLAVAMTAPRTLCHLDVWPNNLVQSGSRTVLLDWAFTGSGGIGEDPANLIVDSVSDGLIDARVLPEIDAAVTDGYVAGLRDGGWIGHDDDVRRAIAAYGAAKYSWFAPVVLGRAVTGALGSPAYGQDRDATEALYRLEGLVTLLARWAVLPHDRS